MDSTNLNTTGDRGVAQTIPGKTEKTTESKSQEKVAIRKIIHVDMDAFYASIEQRDHPEWKGRPLVVSGPPNSRSVVSAASYEARKFGVHSAMPSSQAFRLCPQLIFAPARFDVYKQVSQQIREIFFEYTDLVEPLSLDEAFLDVTRNKKEISSATKIAREIKNRIRDVTNLTASAGVGTGKFVAKIASDINKPDGLTVILPEDQERFLEALPIEKFFGVGKKTAERMKALGIHSGSDLKQWKESELNHQFGKVGTFYYKVVRGIDDRLVDSSRLRKSVGIENTFEKDLKDIESMEEEVRSLLNGLEKRVNHSHFLGRTLSVKMKYSDFTICSRSFTFPEQIKSISSILPKAIELLHSAWDDSRSVRLLGVSVSDSRIKDSQNIEDSGQFELFTM